MELKVWNTFERLMAYFDVSKSTIKRRFPKRRRKYFSRTCVRIHITKVRQYERKKNWNGKIFGN